ncbi:MAG: HesA/MoeB/ThiF family protein [Saprospiraceae bacterium]
MQLINIFERYQRQINLVEFGQVAQEKMLQAKVLVIGAGGLGCPALQYLAAAGVGTIGIMDFDVVDLSNLQRQILYSIDDIGMPKVLCAYKRLKALNPDIDVQQIIAKIDVKNALSVISVYDIIIDGSDNFATRYLINDACALLNKPLVYGAVLRFEGQVGVFNLSDGITDVKTNYRDLFPKPSITDFSCNETGVIGFLPGIIGTMQAAEAIKIISGIGKPLINAVLSYNALTNFFYTIEISAADDLESNMPKSKSEFMDFNYDLFCNHSVSNNEINLDEFVSMRSNDNIYIIDVRELNEIPILEEANTTRVPMSIFSSSISSIPLDQTIVFICQTGIRSMLAVDLLKKWDPQVKAYSLKGGVTSWLKYKIKK